MTAPGAPGRDPAVTVAAAGAETVERRVRRALDAVPDPEIPTCSVTDLGMVEAVRVAADAVEVDLLPTFVGCPAKDVIGQDVERAVREAAGGREVRVRFVYDPPWSTDRITDRGRAGLREMGIAPPWEGAPPPGPVAVPLLRRAAARCPYCGSGETTLESAFGPTLCRTTHFCRSCRNPYEGFKEKK